MAAPEHLRSAHHEEVSEVLRLKAAMHELKQLANNPLDEGDDEIDASYDGPAPVDPVEQFAPVSPVEPPSGPVEMDAEEEADETMPPMPAAWEQAASREDQIRTSVRRAAALDDVPLALKRAKTTARNAVFMVKRCISEKGKEKQLEKELPWSLVPYEERHLYREQELKQWKEHVEFGAVRPLSVEESQQVFGVGACRADPELPICIPGQELCQEKDGSKHTLQAKGEVVYRRSP